MATRLEFDPPPAAPAPAAAGGPFSSRPDIVYRPAAATKYTSGIEPDQSGGQSPERRLEFDASEREQELRAQYGKEINQRGEPGYGERFIDNWSYGGMRPLSGAVRVVGGLFDPTSTAGERWRAGNAAAEDYFKKAEENTAGAGGVATDILGSLASPPIGKVAKAGQMAVKGGRDLLGKIIAHGVTQGTIEGVNRNAQDLGSAVTGGVAGGLVGGAASAVTGGAAKLIPGVKGAQKEVAEAVTRGGGSQAVKGESSAVYKALDNAGIKFKDATPLVQDTIDKMKKEGFNPAAGIHGDLVPVADRIAKLNGKETTWGEIQQIREMLSAVKASDNKQARRMAGHLSDTLDEFEVTAKKTIPANKIGTVSPDDPAKARDLYRRGSQAEAVEFLEKKGMATNPDPNRKLQTNFGSELDKINNPKRFSPFQNNPEQKAMIEKLAVGDPKRAALAKFLDERGGNLLTFGTLGLAGGGGANYFGDQTGIGGAVGSGGATSLGLGLLGKGGARMLNKGITNRASAGVSDLIRNIVTSGRPPTAPNISREALAKLQAVEQAKRAASRFTAGEVTKNF